MYLQKPNIIGYTKILVAFILLSSPVALNAQSETLETYINQKLLLIDQNIQDKRYDVALTKIEELETYSEYKNDNRNRLHLNLVKAKVYYGTEDSQKAMALLLKN